MNPEWYQIHANLVTLTAWMADNGFDACEVAYAVEKPYKFEEEFREATKPELKVVGEQ